MLAHAHLGLSNLVATATLLLGGWSLTKTMPMSHTRSRAGLVHLRGRRSGHGVRRNRCWCCRGCGRSWSCRPSWWHLHLQARQAM